MPVKYVWWDDKRSDPPTRMQLRVPRSLHEFVHHVAELHGVSVNAFMVALIEWACTHDHDRKLRIEVGASRVTVTTSKASDKTPDLASDLATGDRRFPYGKP